MITAQRAREHGIEAQRDGETDVAFRNRVSGVLRDAGYLIEAHEAFRNQPFDQGGDDTATGALVDAPDDSAAERLAVMAVMLGLK